MALALATSVAIRVIRRISSSVTIGLLANPQTPLWMTRTPNPAAPRPAVSSAPPKPPPPPPSAPPAAASPAAAAAAEAAEALEVAVAAAGVDAGVGAAREADVGVAAAVALRFGQRDVCQALELRLERLALRRLGDQIADEIARRDGHARKGDGFDEVSALHWSLKCVTCTLSDRRRYRRHIEVFDPDRRHQCRARSVVRLRRCESARACRRPSGC